MSDQWLFSFGRTHTETDRLTDIYEQTQVKATIICEIIYRSYFSCFRSCDMGKVHDPVASG